MARRIHGRITWILVSTHTIHQFTPFDLMFARKPVLAIDLEYDKKKASDVLADYLNQQHTGAYL